ncbi:hypothetical protein QOT17_020517 [Balamuthia mandrillaris]
MAEPKLSLTQRKNIRDVTPEIDALVQKINAASGQTFSFAADYLTIVQHAQHYKDEPARLVKEYLQHFTTGLEKLCADDMSKEAFLDATPKRTITFVVLSPQEYEAAFPGVSGFHPKHRLTDGGWEICVSQEYLPSNVSEVSENLEALL